MVVVINESFALFLHNAVSLRISGNLMGYVNKTKRQQNTSDRCNS